MKVSIAYTYIKPEVLISYLSRNSSEDISRQLMLSRFDNPDEKGLPHIARYFSLLEHVEKPLTLSDLKKPALGAPEHVHCVYWIMDYYEQFHDYEANKIISFAVSFFDNPVRLAAFLSFLLLCGVGVDVIVESEILHQFFMDNFFRDLECISSMYKILISLASICKSVIDLHAAVNDLKIKERGIYNTLTGLQADKLASVRLLDMSVASPSCSNFSVVVLEHYLGVKVLGLVDLDDFKNKQQVINWFSESPIFFLQEVAKAESAGVLSTRTVYKLIDLLASHIQINIASYVRDKVNIFGLAIANRLIFSMLFFLDYLTSSQVEEALKHEFLRIKAFPTVSRIRRFLMVSDPSEEIRSECSILSSIQTDYLVQMFHAVVLSVRFDLNLNLISNEKYQNNLLILLALLKENPKVLLTYFAGYAKTRFPEFACDFGEVNASRDTIQYLKFKDLLAVLSVILSCYDPSKSVKRIKSNFTFFNKLKRIIKSNLSEENIHSIASILLSTPEFICLVEYNPSFFIEAQHQMLAPQYMQSMSDWALALPAPDKVYRLLRILELFSDMKNDEICSVVKRLHERLSVEIILDPNFQIDSDESRDIFCMALVDIKNATEALNNIIKLKHKFSPAAFVARLFMISWWSSIYSRQTAQTDIMFVNAETLPHLFFFPFLSRVTNQVNFSGEDVENFLNAIIEYLACYFFFPLVKAAFSLIGKVEKFLDASYLDLYKHCLFKLIYLHASSLNIHGHSSNRGQDLSLLLAEHGIASEFNKFLAGKLTELVLTIKNINASESDYQDAYDQWDKDRSARVRMRELGIACRLMSKHGFHFTVLEAFWLSGYIKEVKLSLSWMINEDFDVYTKASERRAILLYGFYNTKCQKLHAEIVQLLQSNYCYPSILEYDRPVLWLNDLDLSLDSSALSYPVILSKHFFPYLNDRNTRNLVERVKYFELVDYANILHFSSKGDQPLHPIILGMILNTLTTKYFDNPDVQIFGQICLDLMGSMNRLSFVECLGLSVSFNDFRIKYASELAYENLTGLVATCTKIILDHSNGAFNETDHLKHAVESMLSYAAYDVKGLVFILVKIEPFHEFLFYILENNFSKTCDFLDELVYNVLRIEGSKLHKYIYDFVCKYYSGKIRSFIKILFEVKPQDLLVSNLLKRSELINFVLRYEPGFAVPLAKYCSQNMQALSVSELERMLAEIFATLNDSDDATMGDIFENINIACGHLIAKSHYIDGDPSELYLRIIPDILTLKSSELRININFLQAAFMFSRPVFKFIVLRLKQAITAYNSSVKKSLYIFAYTSRDDRSISKLSIFADEKYFFDIKKAKELASILKIVARRTGSPLRSILIRHGLLTSAGKVSAFFTLFDLNEEQQTLQMNVRSP